MHETPIAVEIVNRTVELAEQHCATQIERIEVQIGVMRQVVPEALQLTFSMAAEGTLAGGAELVIIEVQAKAVCNACGCQFAPDIDVSFACPSCGQANVRIVAGNDILLTSVVCQADEEVSAP